MDVLGWLPKRGEDVAPSGHGLMFNFVVYRVEMFCPEGPRSEICCLNNVVNRSAPRKTLDFLLSCLMIMLL
jgi:hypothetical protein